MCPEASWIHVYTALKDADEAKLADKIQKEHSLHVPQDDKVTVAVKKGTNNNCVVVCDHAPFHCDHTH